MRDKSIDDALTEIMDAWMGMMAMPVHIPRRFAGIEVACFTKSDIGEWEDRNGEMCITVDMPGIQKKDIELNVDKHSVSVSAKTEDRDYSFKKTFETELNPDKVLAKFNNGVLDMKIHKAEESKGKKITIK